MTCHQRRTERMKKAAKKIGIQINNNKRVEKRKIVALASAIESASNRFSTQTMMSKYFLTFLGCKADDLWPVISSIDSEKNAADQQRQNELQRIKDNIGVLTPDKAGDLMNTVAETIIRLISEKVPISEDLLILSFMYCKHFNRDMRDKLVRTLENTSKECLSHTSKNSKTKARDEQWFRDHLQSSNVWVIKRDGYENIPSTSHAVVKKRKDRKDRNGRFRISGVDNKDDDEDDNDEDDDENDDFEHFRESGRNEKEIGLLFDVIADTIEDTIFFQRKMICDAITNQKSKFGQSWMKLAQVSIDWINENGSRGMKNAILELEGLVLRQDAKEIGIVPGYSGDYLRQIKRKTPNYDTLAEYNVKSYLTQCLVIAHGLNTQFQADMSRLFESIDEQLLFHSAPIKTEDRWYVHANA